MLWTGFCVALIAQQIILKNVTLKNGFGDRDDER